MELFPNKKPYSYDTKTGEEISSSFILTNNIIRFNIPLSENDIVIDPTLDWATCYYGTPDYITTLGRDVAADANGSSYLTGSTSAANNIATTGAHQLTYTSGNMGSQNTMEGYLVKFNLDGTRAWATYCGGEEYDLVNDATCDDSGNIYITGLTFSDSGIATAGSHKPINWIGWVPSGIPSKQDAFLVKFDSSGVRKWGTYYGGALDENPYSVTCDRAGNVFIAGVTSSDDDSSIASVNGFQTTEAQGFLAKFNSSGIRQWGTYYGSTVIFTCVVSDITCDTLGSVYIGGFTDHYSQISTNGSYQKRYGGGYMDGFFAKFDTAGNRLWGSYYGGPDDDRILSIACNRYNDLFLSGTTKSADSIATPGAYQSVFSGGIDGFLARMNATTQKRIWSTYGVLGNRLYAGYDRVIYVVGYALRKINLEGYPEWGEQVKGMGIKMVYGGGKVFVSGTVSDTADFNPTLNGFLQKPIPPSTGPKPSYIFAFCKQFHADTAVYFDQGFYDTLTCLGDTLYIKYDVTNNFRTDNTFTLQLSDTAGSFANPLNINTIFTNGKGVFKYWIPDTITPGIGYRIRIVASGIPDTSYDNGINIRVSAYPKPRAVAKSPVCAYDTLFLADSGTGIATKYSWVGPGSFTADSQFAVRPNMQLTDSGYYVFSADNYGCIAKDSAYVRVYKPSTPVVESNAPVCLGDTLKVWASTFTPNVSSWVWIKPSGVSFTTSEDTTISVSAFSDSGLYIAVALADGCKSDPDTLLVKVEPKVIPSVEVMVSLLSPGPGVDVSFSAINGMNLGASPTYHWLKNGVTIPGANSSIYNAISNIDFKDGDNICVVVTSSDKCASPDTVKSCTIVAIDMNVANVGVSGHISLYPNPNNGKFTIKSSNISDTEINIYLMNQLGQIVFKDIMYPLNRGLDKDIDISNLPAGVYMLQLKTPEATSSFKVMVERE